MGAEEAGGDGDGADVAEAAGDAQHLELACRVEPVAGFDLDRGDALAQESIEAGQRGGEESVVIGGARRRHGRDDAAALAGDLGIARAFEAEFELAGARAGEDEMGVAVDEAGRHPALAAIVDGGGEAIGRAGQRVAPPDECDTVAGDRQRAVGDGAVGRVARCHGGEAEIDPEMVPARGHDAACTLPMVAVFLLTTGKEQAQLSFATPICSLICVMNGAPPLRSVNPYW